MEHNIEDVMDSLREVESKLNLANYHLRGAKRMILKMEEKEIWRQGGLIFYINIPVFMFDWHPASEPNDI